LIECQGSVLLVDDDKFAGRIAELNLAQRGYRVRRMESGAAALTALAEDAFDVALVDMVMPGMTGLELLREIRKTRDQLALPVIVVSGHDQSDKVLAAYQAGANDFVTKSKDYDLAAAKIANQLALKGAAGGGARRVGDALWNWNVKADSAVFSSRWAALLGLDKNALGDSSSFWFDRVHPDDLPALRQAIDDHLARKNAWLEADFRIRTEDRGWLWAHAFGVALFGKDGAASRMFGSLSPLRFPVEAREQSLRLQADKLVSALADLGESGAPAMALARELKELLETSAEEAS